MTTNQISGVRDQVRASMALDEQSAMQKLLSGSGLTLDERAAAKQTANELVEHLRAGKNSGLMEIFLAQYGLSTDEGVALMCLAEALLRVPDNETIDDLIEDKITSSSWGEHLGRSSSSLVNAATWGLLFTGKVLDDSQPDKVQRSMREMIKRLGEPVIRTAVKRAMKEMGRQFVLGESIDAAISRGRKRVEKGYNYSFDMLGEAALTAADATKYYCAYEHAIKTISSSTNKASVKDNSGISIKLSALHPRYEANQQTRVVKELTPIVLQLAQEAKRGNLGLNIDAEEADRLDLSLEVIESVLQDPSLAGWDGFGVVVQAYNRSASLVIDWLYALAQKYDRRIMVRLVKGAYWDTEIKRAQVGGYRDYPVFTRKAATDVSYLCCAKKLLSMGDRIYPQFATHNAHTVAAVMAIASADSDYEFQRLHGMGEALFENLIERDGVRCRIYAPVGKHRDLLAYLVRRLLENGANSSFVNQIVDLDVPIEQVISDPFLEVERNGLHGIAQPDTLFGEERVNSRGWDLNDFLDREAFEWAREKYVDASWQAAPLMAQTHEGAVSLDIVSPSNDQDQVGVVVEASIADVDRAIHLAQRWDNTDVQIRSDILLKVAALYEQHAGEIFAILAREAGKTPTDAVAELREAVDFLRYYAIQARAHQARSARGLFVCISPWNFPLAIFTGQICAALAAGNGVLAKPAETTPLIAFFATNLFYQAGVPREVLQLLPGQGAEVGARLVSSAEVDGVCFTGSTATGLRINQSMAENLAPDAPLIAETGGLNAMIVDSTALPEQAIVDIVNSAFQSAGQRCSALRVLYVQEDIYSEFLEMLFGAIDELHIGDPWKLSTDSGPLISAPACQAIQSYIDAAAEQGRLLKTLDREIPSTGHFVNPSVIKVGGISDMPEEIFGPVLHVATYKASSLADVVDELNATGYGLTFGLHTRIDRRVEYLVNQLNVGNIYINRDQIGAVVGSQPFGGENLSGTGPKAGGPNYLTKFLQEERRVIKREFGSDAPSVSLEKVQRMLDAMPSPRVKNSEEQMPGPTGESNTLYEYARGVVLCLGPNIEAATEQASIAKKNGCSGLIVCPGSVGDNTVDGFLPREMLAELVGFKLVALWSEEEDLRAARIALAKRSGAIIPLVVGNDAMGKACVLERHVCVDTTASGGNVALLAASS